MYWFLLKSILGSVVGSSFYQWWQSTTMGLWFQKHLDAFMQHVAVKYNIEVAKKDAKFQKQFPLIAERIRAIEAIAHPPVSAGGTTELLEKIQLLNNRIDILEKKKKK